MEQRTEFHRNIVKVLGYDQEALVGIQFLMAVEFATFYKAHSSSFISYSFHFICLDGPNCY